MTTPVLLASWPVVKLSPPPTIVLAVLVTELPVPVAFPFVAPKPLSGSSFAQNAAAVECFRVMGSRRISDDGN